MPINEKSTIPAAGWTAWCHSARAIARESRNEKQAAAPSSENLQQGRQHANR